MIDLHTLRLSLQSSLARLNDFSDALAKHQDERAVHVADALVPALCDTADLIDDELPGLRRFARQKIKKGRRAAR